MRARQSQRRLLPSAHDSSAYRRAAGILRDGGGAWACSKGMHLSESVPQDLMCLRSRCVAVRWIQPSDLHVTIEDCSSPSAEPPVPATVHWRQRAPFRSRTRDRQSSYNPQLCSACAPRTVVRRSLGSRSLRACAALHARALNTARGTRSRRRMYHTSRVAFTRAGHRAASLCGV